tara:strand:- start:7561 stop:9048 length:1488 start_codon:yes stop_codon:yes gene_type:complete
MKIQLFSIFSSNQNVNSSLKNKVLTGTFWLYLLQFFTSGLQIVQTIILARILLPEHFGIVGIFLIFSNGLESFTNTGFNKALIQKKEVNKSYLDTAWTVSIVRGLLLFTIIYFGSPFIVDFLNTPDALPVVRVLGLIMLIQGFSNTGTVYFSRNLNFFKQFLWKGVPFLGNFIISIPLAITLKNEWAIAWGMLASSILYLFFSFYLHPYRPRLKYNHKIFKELFYYGKWLFLASVVAFFSKQGDKIFLANLLNPTLLGTYLIAWKFARLPEFLTNPLPNALFPAYSKMQDQQNVLREKYIEVLSIIGFFYIPFVGSMVVLAQPFVNLILGEKWIEAVLPMQILTLGVGICIIAYISTSLFNATGKTNFNFLMNSTHLLTTAIFIYPMIKNYGIAGAAICFLISSVFIFIVWKIEIFKLIRFDFLSLKCIFIPFLSTTFVVLIKLLVESYVVLSDLVILLSTIGIGSILYVFIGILLEKITGIDFILSLHKKVKNF